MTLFGYIIFCVVYGMVYYLALNWRDETSGFLNDNTWEWFFHSIVTIFGIAGFVGWVMDSYSLAMVIAIVLSIIFIAH